VGGGGGKGGRGGGGGRGAWVEAEGKNETVKGRIGEREQISNKFADSVLCLYSMRYAPCAMRCRKEAMVL